MKIIKSIIALLLVLAFAVDASAQSCANIRAFRTNGALQNITPINVDVTTGNTSNITNISNVTDIISFTEDPTNQRLHLIIEDAAGVSKLFSINSFTGSSVLPLFIIDDLFELKFSCPDEKLYGIQTQGNLVKVVEINPATGTVTELMSQNVNLTGAGVSLQLSSGTINTNANEYYFLVKDGPAQELFTVDLATGAFTTSGLTNNGDGVFDLEYDLVTDKIYALRENGSDLDFGEITGSNFTVISSTVANTGFEAIAAIDMFAGEFYVYNTASNDIITLDVNTGATLATETVADGAFELLHGGNPCTVNADFSTGTQLCSGGQTEFIDMSVGASTYEWDFGDMSPPSTDQNPIHVYSDAGTYTVTLMISGCLTSDTYSETITIVEGPSVFLGPDGVSCNDQVTIGSAFGTADAVLWSTGSTDDFITITSTGTYSVEVFEGGCIGYDEIFLELVPEFTVDLGPDLTICDGVASVTLDAGSFPGANYTWSSSPDNSQTLDVSTPGTYSVDVEISGCVESDEIEVVIGNLSLDLSSDIEPVLGTTLDFCEGESAVLSAGIGGVDYSWSTGESTESITVTQSGTYTLEIDQGGCTASDEVFITVHPQPSITLSPEEEFCPILQPTVSLGIEPEAGTTYSWDNGDNGPDIIVSLAGDYTVTAESTEGCISTATASVIEKCNSTFVIANAFSPNGDSANDIFRPNVAFITEYQMLVVNRYGEIIFISDDPNEGWDGTYKEKEQPVGLYGWAVKFVDQDAVQKAYKGNVTLIR